MSSTDRPYEIGVFGATGFTGERIALYLAKLQCSKQYTHTVLIAGRSESKLNVAVQRIRDRMRSLSVDSSLMKVDVMGDVNTDDAQSLMRFAYKVRVIINAAGPFRFLGRPVVDAAVNAKTHYCDVTGEPAFVENMIVEYDDKAKANDVTVVHACGFDSVPSDIGVLYTMQQFKRAHGADSVASHIDTFFTLRTGEAGMIANAGTWNSLIHGLSDTSTLATIRKQLKAKYAVEGGNNIKRLGTPHKLQPAYYDKRLQKNVILFPGADAAIVRNTQTQLSIAKYPDILPHFSIFFTVPSYFYVIFFAVMSFIIKFMTQFKFTRNLLIDYPYIFSCGMFSTEGPTQQQMDETFITFDMFASGYKHIPTTQTTTAVKLPAPDATLHTQLSMPEPGYIATPILAVTAALLLLEENNNKSDKHVIPSGVLTPGAAFKDTDIIQKLISAGVELRVL